MSCSCYVVIFLTVHLLQEDDAGGRPDPESVQELLRPEALQEKPGCCSGHPKPVPDVQAARALQEESKCGCHHTAAIQVQCFCPTGSQMER